MFFMAKKMKDRRLFGSWEMWHPLADRITWRSDRGKLEPLGLGLHTERLFREYRSLLPEYTTVRVCWVGTV